MVTLPGVASEEAVAEILYRYIVEGQPLQQYASYMGFTADRQVSAAIVRPNGFNRGSSAGRAGTDWKKDGKYCWLRNFMSKEDILKQIVEYANAYSALPKRKQLNFMDFERFLSDRGITRSGVRSGLPTPVSDKPVTFVLPQTSVPLKASNPVSLPKQELTLEELLRLPYSQLTERQKIELSSAGFEYDEYLRQWLTRESLEMQNRRRRDAEQEAARLKEQLEYDKRMQASGYTRDGAAWLTPQQVQEKLNAGLVYNGYMFITAEEQRIAEMDEKLDYAWFIFTRIAKTAVKVLLVVVPIVLLIWFFRGCSSESAQKIDKNVAEVQNFMSGELYGETVGEFLGRICENGEWVLLEKKPATVRFIGTSELGEVRINFTLENSAFKDSLRYSCYLGDEFISLIDLHERFP